uniref:Ubiquitin-like protease family profile domain-containing protein n=1 Tax=Compsopogon caeruleus TaxID=31354 RepID=A0A7S1T4D5_9RHOD|mmetsp:Transcript_10190/g.20565  ORF Transcript_10190/g.20565 Transcript_10190/m.20565 type:complete len:595 (+) Transcript_10190:240-2024(+)|eukprot:CAMPEP_0184686264 /NCGR_PEP_ID=MMETSP0312-20130426/21821_1 /TAXON_ID=31354 /ORGANISM="Compsopogon coeruleus, Strain SAG 36.94" /LENGTH=594 /DNA_ID=CAMNT_0027141171 /DNA_START=202 /DNA_END=1986 /DNA_ORIENTATION=+
MSLDVYDRFDSVPGHAGPRPEKVSVGSSKTLRRVTKRWSVKNPSPSAWTAHAPNKGDWDEFDEAFVSRKAFLHSPTRLEVSLDNRQQGARRKMRRKTWVWSPAVEGHHGSVAVGGVAELPSSTQLRVSTEEQLDDKEISPQHIQEPLKLLKQRKDLKMKSFVDSVLLGSDHPKERCLREKRRAARKSRGRSDSAFALPMSKHQKLGSPEPNDAKSSTFLEGKALRADESATSHHLDLQNSSLRERLNVNQRERCHQVEEQQKSVARMAVHTRSNSPVVVDLTVSSSDEEKESESPRITTALSIESSPRLKPSVRDSRLLREDATNDSSVDIGRHHLVPKVKISKRWTPLFSLTERDLIESVRKGRGSEVLVEIPAAHIALRRNDLRRLQGTGWLDDEVINAYFSLLNQRNLQRLARGQIDTVVRIFAFNTFFFTRITQGNKNIYDYSGVRRWTRKASVRVLDKDFIFVPVNLDNFHWVLGVIDLGRKKFRYLDSMHGSDSRGVLTILRRWLADEVKDKYSELKCSGLKLETWASEYNQGIPRQHDGGSCGVFTVLFAEHIERKGYDRVDFDQTKIPALRRRMTLELLAGELPLS